MFCAVHVVLNLDLSYLGYRQVAGCCEQCNEFSGPTKKNVRNLLTSQATVLFSKISQLHRVI